MLSGCIAFLLVGMGVAYAIDSDILRAVVICITILSGGIGEMLIKRRDRARPER